MFSYKFTNKFSRNSQLEILTLEFSITNCGYMLRPAFPYKCFTHIYKISSKYFIFISSFIKTLLLMSLTDINLNYYKTL